MPDASFDLPAADRPAPRILIVRLSALGDIVFATSMLDALRRRWPQARISWLAQAGFAGILDGDPRIAEVIRAPANLFKSPAALWRLHRELRARSFDWVFEVQGLFKSRLVARLAGGFRVGFRSREPAQFWMDRLLDKSGAAADIGSEYRYFAETVSGERAGPPRLIVSDTMRDAIAAQCTARGLARFVAICPFTTRPQKHWPEDHWPQLVQRLGDAGLGPCVMFGGPGDRDAAARIAAATSAPLVNLVGETRLAELPAWLAAARLVIGVDTGLTHIGIAVRTPTVALFGSTCPYRQGAESPLVVMYDALACAPCRRHPTCDGRFDCMRGLTPERAADAATRLLAR